MSGNRTRVNCLEGSYAHHYTNIARLKKDSFSFHLNDPRNEGKGEDVGPAVLGAKDKVHTHDLEDKLFIKLYFISLDIK